MTKSPPPAVPDHLRRAARHATLPDVNVANHPPTDVDGQLHVVLDNMPGALVYTDDDLRIVVCNNRFKEMYMVPQELLQPGRPYSDFLRYLAENGYYGEGDVGALVANACGESAQSFGEELRGSHARRPVVSHSPPPGGGQAARSR